MKEIKRLTRCERGHFYDAGRYDVCPHCEHTMEVSVTSYQPDWSERGNAQPVKPDPAAMAAPGRMPKDDMRAAREPAPSAAPAAQSRMPKDDMRAAREPAPSAAAAAGAAAGAAFGAAAAAQQQNAYADQRGLAQDDNFTVAFYQKTLGTEPVVGWLVCVNGVHFGQDFRIKSGRNFVGRSGSMDICLSGDTAVSRERHMIVTYDPRGKLFFAQPGDTSSALCYLNDKPLLEATALKTGDKLTVGESELMFVAFCGKLFSWEK